MDNREKIIATLTLKTELTFESSQRHLLKISDIMEVFECHGLRSCKGDEVDTSDLFVAVMLCGVVLVSHFLNFHTSSSHLIYCGKVLVSHFLNLHTSHKFTFDASDFVLCSSSYFFMSYFCLSLVSGDSDKIITNILFSDEHFLIFTNIFVLR